ncbi:hypothetical protein GJ633_01880 [Halorubrum sp. CBA1125]|uniref:DUF7519 family protein n=1 Tax=Halorubrum sp. CBA1125 TaxID=2668072 RepID=UPI0012E715A3|nr:hypothetical protein [Halorubrum sp. CBA1125]MUW13535.1 hypothetical protein [Halorubrum sp. CBA1125]
MTVRKAAFSPAVPSAVVAVALAAGVVVSLDAREAVLATLAVQGGGLAVVGIGVASRRRGHRILGTALAVVGAGVIVGAFDLFVDERHALSYTIRFLPGLVGIPLLAGTLLPVWASGSRLVCKLGTGGVFLTVVFSGLFSAVGELHLLLAAVATVVAWDAADNAVGIGEHLGRAATSWRLQVTHTTGSAAVGLAGVAGIHLVRHVAVSDLSLAAFALLFVALLLLLAAIRG